MSEIEELKNITIQLMRDNLRLRNVLANYVAAEDEPEFEEGYLRDDRIRQLTRDLEEARSQRDEICAQLHVAELNLQNLGVVAKRSRTKKK